MITAFASGLGGELAKLSLARLLTPAFMFWAGGLSAVWWSGHGGQVRREGWAAGARDTALPLQELPALGQAALLVTALLLLVASAVAAERLTLPVLRLLEGYWSRPRWLRRRLVAGRRDRHRRDQLRVTDLRIRQARGDLTLVEAREVARLARSPATDPARLGELTRRAGAFAAEAALDLSRLESRLHRTPSDDAAAMPTRLGDVLRSAESAPWQKYGLNSIICWVPLWLVLPDTPKEEITQARLALDNAARSWLWSVLFLVWTPWVWWAPGVAGAAAALAYYVAMLNAAGLFGDLVTTAFDLYRFALYDAAHLPRPATPAEEASTGRTLTRLLWEGDRAAPFRYT